MSLDQLFKGKRVMKDLGYKKFKLLKIESIKENIHRYSDKKVAFKNYSVIYVGGELEIFNSLDDINFCSFKKYLINLLKL